jgi:hypothetical protein
MQPIIADSTIIYPDPFPFIFRHAVDCYHAVVDPFLDLIVSVFRV